jgi:hypothetical protein
MTLATWDLLAVIAALLALALRALDEPRQSTLAAYGSLACSAVAGYVARRRRARKLETATPAR